MIPNNAEIPEGTANPRILASFNAKATPKQAAPCAIFDIAAIGKMNVPPVCVISASN